MPDSRDLIFQAFLQAQHQAGSELAASSDLVDLLVLDPQHVVAQFNCTGMIRTESGEIREANRFMVGIHFPEDYLRACNPYRVLTWFGPKEVFHPNISDRAPVICAGKITPGTPLVDLLYQVFDIITYNKMTVREDDALNRAACAWARQNMHRFPVDRRPLRWKAPRDMEAA